MIPSKLLILAAASALATAPMLRAESVEAPVEVRAPDVEDPSAMDTAAADGGELSAPDPARSDSLEISDPVEALPVDPSLDAAPGEPLAPEAAPELGALSGDWSDPEVSGSEGWAGAPAAVVEEAAVGQPPLGAVGYDSKGRQGRIHIVVPADTLWDISEAYLGTPWVWPSIWKDNREIENPHLIHPRDRIWITPSEMRRVTEREAAMLLANRPAPPLEPAASDGFEPMEMEPLPPAALPEALVRHRMLRVSARESAGLISPDQMAASASIVGRVPERTLLSQEDLVYVGLGESDVEPGDQFTIFRTREKVFDPDTGRLLGYHVEIVGWLEVKESYPETSLARIAMSQTGVEVEDRLIPREPFPPEIPMQPSPEGVEGKISFFPQKRVLMGLHDFVYLNRGSLDGLEVGSPLEVYRTGYRAHEVARHEQVDVPNRVVAEMVVVRAATEASVAVVISANTELQLGDRFRAGD